MNKIENKIIDKRKILFYCMLGYSGGGSDHSLFLHLLHLNKDKFSPVLIYRQNSILVEKLKLLNLKMIHQKYFSSKSDISNYNGKLKIPGSKTFKFNFRVVIEVFILISVILKNNIDIVHLNNNIRSNRAATIAGLLTFRKIIVHDRIVNSLGIIDKFLVKHVHKVITISESVKEQYSGLNLNKDKIITIYNGLDTNTFRKVKIRTNSQIVIGCLGRLVKWKGVHIIINALPKILNRYANIKLLIVGEGRERAQLEKLVKELNIQNSVSFLGNLDNVQKIYNSMDIFIHTAIKPEPFGRVIIEAMACGLPVISTDIGGPKEIITNGLDGYLLPPGDSEVLSEQIICLISNPELRVKIGNNAISTVKSRFDITTTSDNIEKLYDTI